MAERLTRKAKGILAIFEKSGNHWEETFWQLLARTFGTKVNGDAFENLAQHIPFKLLARHKNNLLQLEALLLGVARLLPQSPTMNTANCWCGSIIFYKSKYNLQTIAFPIHFLRMRPQNFPTIRLVQLAALINQTEHFFSKILQAQHVKEIKDCLNVSASAYWNDHFRLVKHLLPHPKSWASKW